MSKSGTPQTRTPDYLIGVERGHGVLVPFDVMDGRQDTIDIAAILTQGGGGVFSVNGRTGIVTLTSSDVGLSNVNNTADSAKPISAAVNTALAGKQDALVSGSNIKTVNGFSLLGSGDVSIAGGGGATNLSISLSPSGVGINSDTGADVVVPVSDGVNAGLMSPAQHAKLDGVAAGATANVTDAQLRDRATHTGTQAIATVSELQTILDSKQATLASGTSIRTVNGATLLGAGDLTISATNTIQTINATGGITAWGSLVRAGNASPITVTLPLAGAGDIGKRITVRNGHAGAVTVAPGDNSTFNHLDQNVLAFFDSVEFEATAAGAVECVGYSRPFDATPVSGSTRGVVSGAVHAGLASKISVGGLKTINGNSLEGSGDITISGGGGGAAATNLSYTASATGGLVLSDTGSDATVPLADGTNAGLMAPSQHTKLAGVAAGATANASDTALLSRANHTGTQAAATITGLAAVATSGAYNSLTGLPALGTAAPLNVPASGDAASGQVVLGSDTRLADSREWTAATVLQAEAESGVATVRRAWTAQRVFQAISAWWSASADASKLAGIAAGATANATDAQLRDRSTHTGTQAAATISDFSTAADARIAAASVNALADVTISAPATGQVLKFNGTAWVNDTDATGGGAAAANLSYTASATGGLVLSDTGSDATVPLADGTNAGLMAPTQHTKLAGIAAGATANTNTDGLPEGVTNLYFTEARVRSAALAGVETTITDSAIVNTDSLLTAIRKLIARCANALSRANHTGTQAISTVTNLQTTLDGKATLKNTIAPTGPVTLTVSESGQPYNTGVTSRAFTVSAGISLGFDSVYVDGPCTWVAAGGVTVTDSRQTGQTYAACALVQTGANTFRLVGTTT